MKQFVYVPLTQERRFLVFALDPGSGGLTLSHEMELATQPWQLCADPRRRYLYQQVRDGGYSGVVTLRIDPETGAVAQIGELELEADACYVATDRTGRFLLAAYLIPGLVTVHPIGDNGVAHGPPSARQVTELYAHSIQTDRSNRFAFVPHVTPTDSIHQFRFDENTGALAPGPVPRIDTAPGHGPRHYAFHPYLQTVYFNVEQESAVAVYRLDPDSGGLELLQNVSTLPQEGFDGKNSTASVRVHPSGRAVYAANRGHNSIAAFSVDTDTGLLSPLGRVPAQPTPRPLGMAPDGDYFFAGSDETGRLTTYRIGAGGDLQPLETYDLGLWVSWVLPLKFG